MFVKCCEARSSPIEILIMRFSYFFSCGSAINDLYVYDTVTDYVNHLSITLGFDDHIHFSQTKKIKLCDIICVFL